MMHATVAVSHRQQTTTSHTDRADTTASEVMPSGRPQVAQQAHGESGRHMPTRCSGLQC
jgi:hypothetical protein